MHGNDAHRTGLRAASATLVTERLRLERAAPGHADGFLRLYGDPAVMAIRRLGVLDPDGARAAFAVVLAHWRAHRFGVWAVLDAADGRFLGECGLRLDEDATGEVKLGYGFFPDAWGRGIATEAARAALTDGFATLGAPAIFAMSRGDNAASHRVLEKLGMRRLWLRPQGRHGLAKYRLDAPPR